MANLITIADFDDYRDITSNLDSTKRLDPYIVEAERFDFRPLLGSQLYYEFINNLSTQKYVDLLNGKNYTPTGYTAAIDFKGIKPVLVYFTYARFLLNDNIKSTVSGFVRKINEFSEPVSESTIARLSSQARASAMSYWQETMLFLNTYTTTYTLWGDTSTLPVSFSGFNIQAIY